MQIIVFSLLETSLAKSKPSIEGISSIFLAKLLISKSFVEIIPLIDPLFLIWIVRALVSISCIPTTSFDFKNSSSELVDLQLDGDSDSFLIINPDA